MRYAPAPFVFEKEKSRLYPAQFFLVDDVLTYHRDREYCNSSEEQGCTQNRRQSVSNGIFEIVSEDDSKDADVESRHPKCYHVSFFELGSHCCAGLIILYFKINTKSNFCYNLFMFRNILILIILITGAYLVFSNLEKNKKEENPSTIVKEEESTTRELCFYKENLVKDGLYDKALLKMVLNKDKVSGEFRNLPAETDSKVGEFSGTVSPVIPEMMARIADVWWNSYAEGMNVTEELRIIFGEGTASVGFGEMVDRGDGVYIYKDKENIGYWQDLTDVSCDFLDDKILVEKFIRENIKNLAPEKPVLGGSWYSYNIKVNPENKSGEFTYEDGHIMGVATFTYERNGESVNIQNILKIK